MSRLISLAFAALAALVLSGCVSYPDYYYVDRDGAGDYYYADPYYDDAYYGDVGYGYWPAYYSVVWPVYHRYYDPWWSPGFYYGVTWFPHTYFGYGLAYYDAWPWYHHYSPYRYSFWDGYYDCDRRHDRGWRDRHGEDHRFGSARNEAERLASISGANRQQTALRGDEWRLRQQGYGADGVREAAPTSGDRGRTGGFGVPVQPGGLYGVTALREIDRGPAGQSIARYDLAPRPDYGRERDPVDVDTDPKPGYEAQSMGRAKPLPYRGYDQRAPRRYYYNAPARERSAHSYGAPAGQPPQQLPAYRGDRGPGPGYARQPGNAPSYAPAPSQGYAKPAPSSGGGWSGGGSKDSGSSSRGSSDRGGSSSRGGGGSRDRDNDHDDR